MNRNASIAPVKQSLALAVQAVCNRRRANHLRRRTSRQVPSAVRETALCAARNAQNAQLRHSSCKSRIPLARLTNETLELLANNLREEKSKVVGLEKIEAEAAPEEASSTMLEKCMIVLEEVIR
jgi:hypothetical protein